MITVARAATSRISERNLDPRAFGTVFSDHMLVAEYRDGAWRQPRVQPYGPLEILPSINGLHYGLSVFEGLKAFRTVRGDLVLFRPRENFARMCWSCRRLTLPEVPEDIFLDGLRELVRLDREWVPAPDEGSLYIRPLVFATDANLRVRPPLTATFVIVTSAVGQYYAEPLRLLAPTGYARAFPGGTGDTKAGGNYAAALLGEREAQQRGSHGALWLDAASHTSVEEAGAMNVFFVIGEKVITPNLSGTILAGVTRDSVMTLLRELGITVEVRPVTIFEVLQAHREGLLRECFGTGTAATIAHIGAIDYADTEIALPPVSDDGIAARLRKELADLRAGRIPDRFGWLVPV